MQESFSKTNITVHVSLGTLTIKVCDHRESFGGGGTSLLKAGTPPFSPDYKLWMWSLKDLGTHLAGSASGKTCHQAALWEMCFGDRPIIMTKINVISAWLVVSHDDASPHCCGATLTSASQSPTWLVPWFPSVDSHVGWFKIYTK